eukprot:SAG31_NODE_14500_length_803_cov_1.022727_1_plen_27_part_10
MVEYHIPKLMEQYVALLQNMWGTSQVA